MEGEQSMSLDELRQQVADCLAIIEGLGLTDFSGHVSARVDENTFLINARDASRSTIGANDIVLSDLDCNLVEGKGVPPSETAIHGELYRMRPDVKAIGHLHTPILIEMSIANVKIVPVIYHGSIFGEGVPIYDDCRHVNTPERGRALAEFLGSRRAAIIRGHGALLAADGVVELLLTAAYLTENAERQYHAMQVGKIQALREEEIREGESFIHNKRFGQKQWNYYASKYLRR